MKISSVCDETWVVTEGAAGMENQCLGLAERLTSPVRTFRITLKEPWRLLAPQSFGNAFDHLDRNSDRPAPPWPALVIGCGRQSVPISRAVRRASSGATVTVQCQDPRIDPKAFDLVIPPEHDELSGPNVFPIVGSPNRITAGRLTEAKAQFADRFGPLRAPRIAVLVGGSSRTHGTVDPKAATRLAHMLFGLASSHGIMVSTSRRTPALSAAVLKNSLETSGAVVWDGSGPNPYLGMLAWAEAFVVTADSVNMTCEAAATGRPVHVFPLENGRRKAKFFQQSMTNRGITRPFTGTIEQWSYPALNEAERAAERIKSLLDARESATDMRCEGRA